MTNSGSQYLVNGQTHYERNKEAYFTRALEQMKRIRDYLRQRKEESGCVDCGIKDWRVLDFDHVGDKTITPAKIINQGWSQARIDKELEQCEVRCANCHRIKTLERAALV